jgi:hypothetical protein
MLSVRFTVQQGAKSITEELENLPFGQKSQCKVGAEEGLVSEGINTIKKKPKARLVAHACSPSYSEVEDREHHG